MLALPIKVADSILRYAYGISKRLRIKHELRDAQKANVDTITTRLKRKPKEHTDNVRRIWKMVLKMEKEKEKTLPLKISGSLVQLPSNMHREVLRRADDAVERKRIEEEKRQADKAKESENKGQGKCKEIPACIE